MVVMLVLVSIMVPIILMALKAPGFIVGNTEVWMALPWGPLKVALPSMDLT